MWKSILESVNKFMKNHLQITFIKSYYLFSELIPLISFIISQKILLMKGSLSYTHINTPNSSNKIYI